MYTQYSSPSVLLGREKVNSIPSPHFNLLLYDPTVQSCIEIVLDSDRYNIFMVITTFMIMVYKYEPDGLDSGKSLLSNVLKDCLESCFMVPDYLAFIDLLNDGGVISAVKK